MMHYSIATRRFYCDCPKDGGPQNRWIMATVMRNDLPVGLKCIICGQEWSFFPHRHNKKKRDNSIKRLPGEEDKD